MILKQNLLKLQMTTIITNDGIRYKQYESGKMRKICQFDTCTFYYIRGSEYCNKHNPTIIISENEKRCGNCHNIKKRVNFEGENKICNHCLHMKKLRAPKRIDQLRRRRLQIKIDMGGKCIDCEIDDLEVLEFDHVTPGTKVERISIMGRSEENMRMEAAKCVLRCTRCHAKKTRLFGEYGKSVSEDKKIKKARKHVDEIKRNSTGCTECGYFDKDYLNTLHFDHLIRETKVNSVATMVKENKSIEEIDEEISKCRILCANCHQKHSNRQLDHTIVNVIKEMMETARDNQ